MKKWITVYLLFMAAVALAAGAFNFITDPFGLFGDRFMDWYAFNMTANPRAAKIAYLDKNHEKYDSYIIGCSKTGSFSVDTLNRYHGGASFYNMLMYGGDMYDIQVTARYILENYNPKNIIINIGLEESTQFNIDKPTITKYMHAKAEKKPLTPFYAKYLFANPSYGFNKIRSYYLNRGLLPRTDSVFIPQSGTYNKSLRDTRPIGNLEEYLALPEYEEFSQPFNQCRLVTSMDEVLDTVRQIKELCEIKGATFRLIASPVYYKEVDTYDPEQLKIYWRKLAQATDFWDFSGYSPISFDPRYFYDVYHFRNAVGEMALAYIFNEKEAYLPQGFGHYTTRFNVDAHAQRIFTRPLQLPDPNENTASLPILMYHHLDADPTVSNDEIITPEKFRGDMQALLDKGYTAITYREAEDYAIKGVPLPEKPVIITFDDGYYSNYKYAYPILKELGMKAVISVIGISMGKNVYKNTNHPIFGHFDYDDAKEMYDSGVIDIQSHGFSVHDSAKYESVQSFRLGAMPGEKETEEEYIQRFVADFEKSKTGIEENVGNEVRVYTYPFGLSNQVCEILLWERGITATVTTKTGVNEIVRGLPQSLYGLKRINVGADLTSAALIEKIENWGN